MPNYRPFPPYILWQLPRNLSGWTDGQTGGHIAKQSQLVWWTNRPMYRWKEGISGFGQMDGQPKNIMPPAPKSGGITKQITPGKILTDCFQIHVALLYTNLKWLDWGEILSHISPVIYKMDKQLTGWKATITKQHVNFVQSSHNRHLKWDLC